MTKQDEKVLEIADKYVKPEDRYEWRLYWYEMGKLLEDAR